MITLYLGLWIFINMMFDLSYKSFEFWLVQMVFVIIYFAFINKKSGEV